MSKTVKIIVSIAVAVIIIGVLIFIGKPVDEQNIKEGNNKNVEYKDYVNNDFNIKLSYPENYELKEEVTGAVVVFMTKKENFTDQFRENISLIVQDLSDQPMTLEEYNNLSLEQIELYITDVEILYTKEVELSGEPAYEVVYSGKQEGFDLKWKQKWTIVDDVAYVLSYTSELEKFDKYNEEFNQIFNSFELIN